ncbi:hypothetical protein NP493_845g01010 [Ridgeia piscesae]|uniref:GDP-fucose protein O-fucosyltransferase 2 n=1 Tax=Ridgeia piscesae TaxID=27915 RepID=A0AAD9KNT0_RIDPI|nr:hypothetical protein NP493_845g01010 [Ridgeia piscesae]
MADVAHCWGFLLLVAIILTFTCKTVGEDDLDDLAFQAGNQQNVQFGPAKKMRYLLYSINPGEGFNLRRDVYMRVANLVKLLNEKEPFTLVLPPWGRLYHWKSNIRQLQLPWSHFFDIDSLARHVPVMEFEDFLKVNRKPEIDIIYYLQRFKEGWRDGKWEERIEFRDCIDDTGFKKDKDGRWRWWFWGYEQVYGKKFSCVSLQLEYKGLVPFLMKNADSTVQSIFLGRAEKLTHGSHSEWSKEWWTARRSMRFAKRLRDVGDKFRLENLNSTDETDQTVLDPDWRTMRRERGTAVGGPYMAVHLRRLDYKYAHKENVPSIPHAAKQIKKALKKNKLDVVYISTDAPDDELDELRRELKGVTVTRFERTKEALNEYKDGGIAIIEQWICAHARYFMGTAYSTFSFRLHEEREILGFSPESTYNCFCGTGKDTCDQPSKWITKYE